MLQPFEGLLGNNTELRTLEFLLPLNGIEFNISELADEIGVTRQTLSRVLKKFENWGVVRSRTSGQAILYSINDDSPLVKSIAQLNNVIIETMLGTEKLYEIREYLERKDPAADRPVLGGYGNYIYSGSIAGPGYEWGWASSSSMMAQETPYSAVVPEKEAAGYPGKIVHSRLHEQEGEYAA